MRLKERKKKKKGKKSKKKKEREKRFKTGVRLTLISVRNLTNGSAIMNIRRLPGFMYHYKLATVLLMSSFFLVVYLLLHWGVMCTNLEAWRHVSTVVSFTVCYSDRSGVRDIAFLNAISDWYRKEMV